MQTRLDTTEILVYVGSGAFAIFLFGFALRRLLQSSSVSIGLPRLAFFVVGFTLFMGSYFAAWFIWDWLHGDSQQ